MTVAELIEKLGDMPPEADVKIDGDRYTLDCEGMDLRVNDDDDSQYVLLWGM